MVQGVEPGPLLRRGAVARVASFVVATLEEAAKAGPYDAITLWDVLEHIDAPQETLGELSEILRPTGRVLVRVPDARVFQALQSSLLRRLVAPVYLTLCHPTNPEEHRNHFTPASLESLGRASGLEPTTAIDAGPDERVAAGWNSLDGFLRRMLHVAGRGLPYEFTLIFEGSAAQSL